MGVWSRRPQLLRSFGTLHSGYSGRVKDSSFRARRAHDECRLSAEPLPIPPHGSILSQAPRRRSAPHRYPHRYPSTVSTTARSLPRLLSLNSHTRLVVAATQRPHGRQQLRRQVPAKLKSSFLLLGAGADKPRRLSLTHSRHLTHASRVRHGPCAPCTMRQTGCRPMSEGRGMLLRWSRTTVPCK